MKVIITDYEYNNVDQEREIITKAGIEFVDFTKLDSVSFEDALRDADGLLVQYAAIDRAFIEKLERCKVILRYGIGYDNIDAKAAGEMGIVVCNVPDYGIDEVSNHAIALMMALHRKIPKIVGNLREGVWNYESLVPIKRLEGSVLGLVGLGRIPRVVAKKMSGFDLRILAYDPFVNPETAKELGVELVDFDRLCCESDIISIHCPLTDDTNGLFDAQVFGKMKNTAILINTARGPVVNEADLVEALRNGNIAAAGLDTFEKEPITKDNPLVAMDNVICTSHCAWYSDDSIRAVQAKGALEVANVLTGGKPFNPVNLQYIKGKSR